MRPLDKVYPRPKLRYDVDPRDGGRSTVARLLQKAERFSGAGDELRAAAWRQEAGRLAARASVANCPNALDF